MTAPENVMGKGVERARSGFSCEPWCDSRSPDMITAPCDCGAERRRQDGGYWGPHRDKAQEAGSGWETFLSRLDLSYWPETERCVLRGQDGWAFNVAVRFQTIACDLAESNSAFYWSSYYLLARIIEKTRTDMTMLEAVEAIAIAFFAKNVTYKDVVAQFQQMDIWPAEKSHR